MGRCHEFGLQIREGCGHPMEADDSACSCPECGVICGGRFAGCPDVWARGLPPAEVQIDAEEVALTTVAPFSNGSSRRRAHAARVDSPIDEQAPHAEAGPEPGAWPERTYSPPAEANHSPTVPAANPPAASAAALRWLEGAFAGLRNELQSLRGFVNQQNATMAELVSGITQQQSMLAQLLEARGADVQLVEAAERLPQIVTDTVAREMEQSREETVAAVASKVDAGQTAMLSLAQAARDEAARRDPGEAAAELRSFLENDPDTASVVALIATQAATQAMRSEVASQLPAALGSAMAQSDARLEELTHHMDKVVARAVRAGARTAAANGKGAPAAAGAAAAPRPAKASTATVKRAAPPARPAQARAAKAAKPATTRQAKAAPKAAKVTKAAKATKATSSGPAKAAKRASTTKTASKRSATKARGSGRVVAAPAKATARRSTRTVSSVRRTSRARPAAKVPPEPTPASEPPSSQARMAAAVRAARSRASRPRPTKGPAESSVIAARAAIRRAAQVEKAANTTSA
ncbi:MAG: hypothetical protein ACR2HY_07245 [Acidimicrobiales bacterium]